LGVFDVNAGQLIDEVAGEFQKQGIQQPEFVDFVKSGQHRERAPHRKDWYFVRMASILYRLHKDGPTGTGSLRTYYGGRKNRGVQKHHRYKASGKVIRTCLQELEKHGYLIKEKTGRKIAGKGHKLLNEKANVVGQTMKASQQHKDEAFKDRMAQRQKWKAEKSKAVEVPPVQEKGKKGKLGKDTKGKMPEKQPQLKDATEKKPETQEGKETPPQKEAVKKPHETGEKK
jgi:small subunit ribosomal protein S19e